MRPVDLQLKLLGVVTTPPCYDPRIAMFTCVTDTEVKVPRSTTGAAGKLSMLSRITALALGIAGLALGALAVFVTHLEAGPVALLAVGLIFMIVGLAGILPTRLKVGDNEAAWEIEREAVQVFVERVAEEAPVERQPDLLDALGELAEDAPQVAAVGISAMAYERQLREEINQAIEQIQTVRGDGKPIKFTTQITADRQRTDAILEGPTGRLVAIEVKISGKNLSSAWFDILHQKIISQSRAWRGPGVMLLITRDQLSPAAQNRLSEYPEIHHVIFGGPRDRAALLNALIDVMTG